MQVRSLPETELGLDEVQPYPEESPMGFPHKNKFYLVVEHEGHLYKKEIPKDMVSRSR